MIANQILFFYSILQCVVKVGNSGFATKNSICIGVHIIFRRRSQTDKETVEILENGAVTVKDAAVCFVDNDQVKTSGRETLVLCIYIVDHCLVGAEHEACIEILFAACR